MKKIYIISNTHWDREWYMSHEKYLVRLVKLCDRLVGIMEKNENYIFISDGQFSMIDDYLRIRPEMTERVRTLVKEGRLKVGPWFTQPLETLTGGEALLRNLHYGIEGSEKLGAAMRFSYEIDEFGHASQMPQIYRNFGIRGAMAWRGMPRGTRSAFTWTSPDGSSVTMLYSNSGYGEATDLPSTREDYTETIDYADLPRPGLDKRVEHLLNLKNRVSDVPCQCWLNGIDHSFPQHDLLEVIDLINEVYPDVEVRQSHPEEFLEAILREYRENNLPMANVRGELMYTAEDILESTHSCHTRQKILHYKAERFLDRVLEPTSVLSLLAGDTAKTWETERAWMYVLENHAHDTLGCTSVDEVFREAMSRYTKSLDVAAQAAEDGRRAVMARMKDEPSVVVFNTNSFEMGGVTEFVLDVPPGYVTDDFELRDENDALIPLRILHSEPVTDVRYNPRKGHPTYTKGKKVTALADLPAVPAFGWRRFSFRPYSGPRYQRNRTSHFLSVEPGVMENEFLRCVIEPNGTVSMYDKLTNTLYPSQFLFEDTGEAGDVYVHIPPTFGQTLYSGGCRANIMLRYDTPLACSYEVKLTLDIPEERDSRRIDYHTKPVDITLLLTLKAGIRRLECDMILDNHAKHHRLRVLFPTHIREATLSRGGQPFDFPERNIREPEITAGVREQPYPTHPMQDICDVTGETHGLTIAAGGIYEYECIDDASRALALTVLRSNNLISATFGSSDGYELKEAENLCEIRQKIALIPHGANWREAYPEALKFLAGMTVTLNRSPEESVLPDYTAPARILPDLGGALDITGDNLLVTALKPAFDGDGIIVRVLNYGEHETAAAIRFTFPGQNVTSAERVTMNEEFLENVRTEDNTIPFTVKASEVLTFRIRT